MAEFDDVFCYRLPPMSELFPPVITFPGGAEVEAIIDATKNYSACALNANLLAQLQAAMAPLMPMFKIVDLVTALAQCGIVVADIINRLPLPPTAQQLSDLATCSAAIAEALAVVTQLFAPALAIAKLIKGLSTAVLNQIDCIITQLQYLDGQIIAAQAVIANASETGANAVQVAQAQCKLDALDQQAQNVMQMLASIGRILCLVRILLSSGLIPGADQDDISLPSDPSGLPIDLILQDLTALRDAIQTFLELPAFNIPGLELTAGGSFECSV